ncbi:MAG: ATP-dependent helicase HrpB [Rhodoplanes sp.]|uniref:ATP-dependent helicase HrpB n=1 Tax=Rhodoplanes sp. TaxID=1968906 RepID=UPI001820E0DC|nr:ATP-dependent helicase HrpB [Rhodoplanes sp.]NVO17581.1 ATP-dependent helicase HrpB [Rhodoplanes sp.]
MTDFHRFDVPLPIDEALPALVAALAARDAAVLVAPPGAGKTTRVPLVLAEEPWAKGKKILVLEPRRLAARAAAARMAATLGEAVGETVGYRVRFGSKISGRTRIEVVTEGVFTRMILDDPILEGVAAVLFDEFHERSLDADLGLALARDAQQGLREDLKLLVMSATIDGARIAKSLGDAVRGDAPVIASEGRAFPVETRHLPRDPGKHLEPQVAEAVLRALRAETGSILVFLPGAAEIRRTETLLGEKIADPAVDVVPLYGALDADVQDRAVSPAPPGRRKVVLATSIAETSLTIEGVRVVVDSGLARVPRYEPDLALTRLETVRVSRAAADQRRGRAGRTEPGVCWRLWDERETASLEPFVQPEILAADLTGFVLDLAHWGVTDPAKLLFLDPPPAPALAEAGALLRALGALDADGRITDLGQRLRALPLPPRLSRMVLAAAGLGAAPLAADIAVVVTERGLGGTDPDIRHRVDGLRRDRSRRAEDARRMAARWAEIATAGRRIAGSVGLPDGVRLSGSAEKTAGALLALAYPDRVARNRGGGTGAVLLASGRGATVDPASALARESFLTVAELAGSAGNSRVLLAAPVAIEDIEALFADRIVETDEVTFDPASASLRARWARRLGAVALAERPVKVVPNDETARRLAENIGSLGLARLPWSTGLTQWRDRVNFLHRHEGEEWPDLSDDTLLATIVDWLAPALSDKTTLAELGADDLSNALHALLPWNLRKKLDHEAPTHFEAPSGSRVPIDYESAEGPKLAIRVQELFGLDRHPTVAGGRVPLVVELLSPAHRPVQITRDLPTFWRGSYADVRTDLRGRYPKHPWPEDPLTAPATHRAKPRGT